MNRRHLLRATTALSLIGLLAACAGQNGTVGPPSVDLPTAKLWVADVAGAVVAAAGAYTGPSADLVHAVTADLAKAAAAFGNLGDVSTARSAALAILSMIQQISPLIAPLLGPAAPFLPIGLAVISAFVSLLPLPPDAPPTPPAALRRAAMGRLRP